MKKLCLAATMLGLTASLAAADEVQLTNGRKIVGIATKKDQKVMVEVGAGTITLDAKEVSAINPGRTPLHEFQDKANAIKDSRNASDHWNLAQWAKSNNLHRYVGQLAMRVIQLEPDHAAARAALRHEKIGGKWLTYEQAQESRGLKWSGDRWVTVAEIQLMEKRRLEAKERAMAAERERDERREEEMRRRQMAIDEHNARMAHMMGDLDGYFHQPSAFWPPYFRPYWWAPYVRSRRNYQYGGSQGYYGGGGGALGTFDLFRFIPDAFLKKK